MKRYVTNITKKVWGLHLEWNVWHSVQDDENCSYWSSLFSLILIGLDYKADLWAPHSVLWEEQLHSSTIMNRIESKRYLKNVYFYLMNLFSYWRELMELVIFLKNPVPIMKDLNRK